MPAESYAYIEEKGFHLRGLVGAAVVGGCAAAAVLSAPAWPPAPMVRTALVALGWVAFVVGAGWRFWATLYVGGRKVGGRRENVLTVEGPYSVVRNPLYVGSFLIGLSAALLLQSATVAFAVLVCALHYVLITVPAEERFLRREVGSKLFDDYCARTPRYLPNFGLYRTSPEIPLYVKAVRNEARRMLRMLSMPLLLTLLGAARHADAWPIWFRLP
jgi:protein-S-isoprenylcysteine O-methyltransferase Ste14